MWDRMYAGTVARGLPWFSTDPFPPLVRAVEDGCFQRPGPILDVGCGLGTNVHWLASQGFRATGIDVAQGAIDEAESRRVPSSQTAEFVVDDILASRLPAGRFRGSVDAGCFHTLPPGRRKDYAIGLARLVRPGATHVLSWVAREETGAWGPPHRLSVKEVVDAFEPRFRIDRVELRPRTARLTRDIRRSARPLLTLSGYTARLTRRRGVQPPPR
jgi:SAM-dependent methyltransferase